MNISKDDAAKALGEIGQADARMASLRAYAEAAPFLITWGLVWLVANAVTDFDRGLSDRVWLAGVVIGTAVTVVLIVINGKRRGARIRQAGGDPLAVRRRAAMIGVTLFAYSAAMAIVLAPLSVRQGNAFISLFWAFAYMLVGAWTGWRLFAVGAFTAAAIVFGYLMVEQHYFLWMAVFGGGSLIAGGLWLRRV